VRGWVWHWWEVGGGRESGRRVNMVQIMYTHVCKGRKLLVETVPGIRRGQIKESSAGDELKYDIFDTL
jgi:hypothetical protein